jgi:hypothetical protein
MFSIKKLQNNLAGNSFSFKLTICEKVVIGKFFFWMDGLWLWSSCLDAAKQLVYVIVNISLVEINHEKVNWKNTWNPNLYVIDNFIITI